MSNPNEVLFYLICYSILFFLIGISIGIANVLLGLAAAVLIVMKFTPFQAGLILFAVPVIAGYLTPV
jgi:hypothetical protein